MLKYKKPVLFKNTILDPFYFKTEKYFKSFTVKKCINISRCRIGLIPDIGYNT